MEARASSGVMEVQGSEGPNSVPVPEHVRPSIPTHRAHSMHARPLCLIVHAFGGHPKKFWYQKLCRELAGVDCEILRMTRPKVPVIATWLRDLSERIAKEKEGYVHEETEEEDEHQTLGKDEDEDEMKCPPRRLFLIGHSVGCQTIIRFLAQPSTSAMLRECGLNLAGCVCVAAWFAIDEPWDTISPWCTTPINTLHACKTMEEHGAELLVVLSDDDPYTRNYEAEATKWRTDLGAEVIIVSGRRHFGGRTQVELFEAARQLITVISEIEVR